MAGTARTKGFNLRNSSEWDAVDAALRSYKDDNPGALDTDALLAFIASWGQEHKTALVPGSSDALRSFDLHMAAARNEIVALAQEIADARDKARLEVLGELDGLRSRQDALAEALKAEQSKVAELTGALDAARVELEGERARADAAEAKLAESEDVRSILRRYLGEDGAEPVQDVSDAF